MADLTNIAVHSAVHLDLAELVARKRKMGHKSTIKDEASAAISWHIKKEWRKLDAEQ